METETKVIQFTATWCGPCQTIEKDFVKLSEVYKVPIVKVDVDNDVNNLMVKYNVKSIPHIVFLINNEISSVVQGANLNEIQVAFEKIKKTKKNQIDLPKLKEAEITK